MTKKKIRELTTLSAVDDLDLLAVVDIDEPVLENQTKKVTVSTLLNGLSAGSASPLTTKGDLYTHTGSTDTRLPVGTNGQILSANSTASNGTGLEWINPTSPGEPYVSINATGTEPIAPTNSIIIGENSQSTGINSVVLGNNLTINSDGALNIGKDNTSTGTNSIVMGTTSSTTAADGVSIGFSTEAGLSATAIGSYVTSSGQFSTTVGWDMTTTGDYAVSYGNSNFVDAQGAVAIGSIVTVSGENAVSVGVNSFASAFEATSIGAGADAAAIGSVSIGRNSYSGGDYSIALGSTSQAINAHSIAIGTFSISSGESSVCLGASTEAGEEGLALGANARSEALRAVQINSGGNNIPDTIKFGNHIIANIDTIQALAGDTSLQSGLSSADGSLFVNTDTDSLLFRSNGAWVSPGGGEPYVEINSTGTQPTATGTNSIAIGNNTSVSGGNDSIGIGARNTIDGPSQFILGTDNTIGAGTSSVYTFSSSNQIIGDENTVLDSRQVYVYGEMNAITGVANTVVFGEDNVVTGATSGTADQSNIFNNVIVGNSNVITDITQAAQLGGRVQIGFQHINNGTSSYQTVQLGSGTTIGNNSEFSMAFGEGATIGDTAPGAVQIGNGTNNTTNTLQFRSQTIATNDGVKIPYQTTGIAPTSTPADGTLVLDNNGGTTTLWARANGAWVSLVSV